MRRPRTGEVSIWNYVALVDVIFVPLHIGFAYSLLLLPDEVKATPFYTHFENIAPLWMWAAAIWLYCGLIVLGLARGKTRPIHLGYGALGAIWMYSVVIAYRVSPSFVGLNFYFWFMTGCILRIGLLRWQNRQRTQCGI